MALHTIELFAGVGMLGEGLRAGLSYLGIETRAICYVEREAFAASVLVARMQEKSLDEAPVWSDVCTFNARAWRGKVDCIVAGFPCQDLSVAGKRVGLDGKRSGLFFEVTRIAHDSGAWLMLLENVNGIHSASATVVDETEGELEERAASRVMGELADLGWDAEWITIPASEAGAAHERARWFCLAWKKVDHPTSPRCDGTRIGSNSNITCGECVSGSGCSALADLCCERRQQVARRVHSNEGTDEGRSESYDLLVASQGSDLGYTGLQHSDLLERADGTKYSGTGFAVVDPECTERRSVSGCGARCIARNECERREEDRGAGVSDEALANADREVRRGQFESGCAGVWRAGYAGVRAEMAYTDITGLERRELGRTRICDRGGGSTWTS